MKRKLSVALVASLLLMACGQSSGANETTETVVNEESTEIVESTGDAGDTAVELLDGAQLTAGSYTATAAGRNGDVSVTITVSESGIESIEVEHEETPEIGDTAIDSLKELTLSSQRIPADSVSGATVTSTAYIQALSDALTQAGANADELVAEAESILTEYVQEADIIVVGAGGAGLTAALTASENGASVILLERSGRVGGNTVAAANGINAADAQVQLSDESYQELGASIEGLIEVQSQNDKARANLVEAFAENSGELIDWVSEMSVAFEVVISEDSRNSVPNNYMLRAITEGEASTATTMVSAIKKSLDESDVNLYTGVDVYELVTDTEGNVIGVKARDAQGSELTFTGKAVILATGGFGYNKELIASVNERLSNAITDEIAPTDGTGLLMAQELGAATVDLGEIQTFPVVIEAYGMVTPDKLPGGFTVGGTIYVNQEGERFTAEAFESVDAILSQTDGKAYMIFSEEDMNEDLLAIYNAGFIKTGESAQELAENLGIDVDAFTETLENWNTQIANGTEDAFGREGGKELSGTLYGFQFGVGTHYFMGGILINEDTQVLDMEENAISGLYAAGEVTGGFHGTQRVDGSGLGDSFVFGRIAGRVVSEAVLANE